MNKCCKKCFTKFEASLALAKADGDNKYYKGHTRRKEKRMYKCKFCNCYHLISQEKRR